MKTKNYTDKKVIVKGFVMGHGGLFIILIMQKSNFQLHR